jgi:hypothetical protein
MVSWVDAEPEFDHWPSGTNYFSENKDVAYDKNDSCVV